MIIKVCFATFLGVILSGIWFETNILLQISKVKIFVKIRANKDKENNVFDKTTLHKLNYLL